MTHIAFGIYCLVLLALVVLWKAEHRPQSAPVIHASEPVSVVPWRLYTLCPPNRTNVPILPRERVV